MGIDFPQLKLKMLTNFPSAAYGKVGITINYLSGGNYINLDYSKFMPPILSLPGTTANLLTLASKQRHQRL